jgi:hypothetical protein
MRRSHGLGLAHISYEEDGLVNAIIKRDVEPSELEIG